MNYDLPRYEYAPATPRPPASPNRTRADLNRLLPPVTQNSSILGSIFQPPNQEGQFSPLSAKSSSGGGSGLWGPIAAAAASGLRGLSALGSRFGASPPSLPQIPESQPSFFGMRNDRPQGGFPGNANSQLLDRISMGQLGQFMAAPYQLVNQMNNASAGLQQGISRYNDRLDRGYDRQLARDSIDSRERMFNNLSQALLGGGSSDAEGISDTNSGLRVGGGTVSTNISARPLPLAAILGADTAMRNTPAGVRGPNVSPQAQQELQQMMQGRLRQVAPNVERDLINVNSPFARAIQMARGNQFEQLAALQQALQGDEIHRQGANVRNLMQMIGRA